MDNSSTKVVNNICPYTGLRSFSEEDALYFKGRDLHSEKAVELLEKNKFIMLTGASGDGKSSLVYAGIIPKLRGGFIKTRYSKWTIVDFRPERQPIINLANSLSKQLKNNDSDSINTSLHQSFNSLVDLYKNSSFYYNPKEEEENSLSESEKKQKKNEATNLLILVDQFEELFTNPENYHNGFPSENANLTVNLLLETNRIALQENLPVYIICTMRSDYIGFCTAFRDFPDLVGKSLYFVPRLIPSEIIQVIEEPALLCGAKITKRLVERILKDLKEGQDILPVLQHALYRIWKIAEEENTNTLDLIQYCKVGGMSNKELPDEDKKKFLAWFSDIPPFKRALYENPGLENVINLHANELYETAFEYYNSFPNVFHISKEYAQKIIKKAFTCLTKMDKQKAVRNRMSVNEIIQMIGDNNLTVEIIVGVLKIFRSGGNTFLHPYDQNPSKSNSKNSFELSITEDTVLDITHEAFIRNWKLLAKWTEEENESIVIFKDLLMQLNRWEKNNFSRSFFLSSGQLNYFMTWYKDHKPSYYWIYYQLKDKKLYENLPDTDFNPNETELKDNGKLISTLGTNPYLNIAKKIEQQIEEFLQKSAKNINLKKNLFIAALSIISLLLIMVSIGFFNSNKQKNKAILAGNISKSNELAMRSFIIAEDDPTLAFRLGEAAFNIDQTSLSKQAIMNAYCQPMFYSLIYKHSNIAKEATFSPDSKLILSYSDDNSAVMSDVAGNQIFKIYKNNSYINRAIFSNAYQRIFITYKHKEFFEMYNYNGNLLRTYKGHLDKINSFDTSVDSQLVVTASDDKTARLWNFLGQGIAVCFGHTAPVIGARISPDNKLILSYSLDNTARVFDTQGKELLVLRHPEEKINYAKFSGDGKTIITANLKNSNKILIWDLKGNLIKTAEGHTSPIKYLMFSRNGNNFLSKASGHTAILWNTDGEKIIELKRHEALLTWIDFSPDGETIITVTEDNKIRLWNKKGQLMHIFKPNDLTYSAKFSPNGKYMVTSHNHGWIYLWNIENLRSFILADHDEKVFDVCYSPSGENILTSSWDNTARLWDSSGKLLHILIGHTDKLYYGIFSNDGKKIITSSEDNTVRIWDINGNCLSILEGHKGKIYKPVISPNGKYILTSSADGSARLWDFNGTQILIFKGHVTDVKQALFSPDGNKLLTASVDKTARLWDMNGNMLYLLKGHKNVVYRIAFAPDGKLLATASDDSTAKIWNISGKEIATCKGHNGAVTNVIFSHSGKHLATCSEDNTIRLWNLEGKQLQVFTGHSDLINGVYFSRNDSLLLSSSDDGTARLWKVNGTEVNVYKGHKGAVQDAKFSPDEKMVLTASGDGTARIWPLYVEDALSLINNKKVRGYVWSLDDNAKKSFGIE